MPLDVVDDRIRDQIADRLSGLKAPTHERRGDRNLRHREEVRALTAGQVIEGRLDRGPRRALTVDHGQRREGKHPLWLSPLRQPRGDVASENQVKLAVLDDGVQLLKGIDGVRRTTAADLEIGDREALIAADGQAAQLQPVTGTRVVAQPLVRRGVGRDQENLVELELDEGLLRTNEMAKMRRVEGAAEDSDAH